MNNLAPVVHVPSSRAGKPVLDCVKRITNSKTFAGSEFLKQLLKFLVTKVVRSESHTINEYSLGVEVFRRKQNFDPRIDTIVRVQIRRLRLKLAQYYSSEGRQDPLRIEIPRGSYVPVFRPVKYTLAVLPFLDLRNGIAGDTFSDTLTETLIDALTQEESLDVTSRTSVFQFKNQHKDVRQIGKQLNVDIILEGSLQGLIHKFRIMVRLVSVTTGFTLWTTSLENNTEDSLNISNHVSSSIIPQVKALLSGGHLQLH